MKWSVALVLTWCAACASLAPRQAAVLDAERARFAAMTSKDLTALGRLLGEDLVYCHSDGRCETKTEFIETIRTERIRYHAIEVLELRPRAVGDAVVVNGSIAVDGAMGGQPRQLRVSFTDVHAHRDGRWQLIAWQSTRIP